MAKIFEFPAPNQAEIEKNKKNIKDGKISEESGKDNIVFLAHKKLTETAPEEIAPEKKAALEEKSRFILKWTEVANILGKLKRKDPSIIKKTNNQLRLDQAIRRAYTGDLKDVIMKADEEKIKKDPAYYNEVLEEISRRGWNKFEKP